ncbi:MAG: methyltransferase [Syntrophomonadaceae bacterium]|nr:methyltransferase [Syntrophomonadaceae bacterium]
MYLWSNYSQYRSIVKNKYASTLIRIQTDRKQRVVSTGVYGLVRHPLYLGGLLWLGAPLLLGSIYGFIVSLVLTPIIVLNYWRRKKAGE